MKRIAPIIILLFFFIGSGFNSFKKISIYKYWKAGNSYSYSAVYSGHSGAISSETITIEPTEKVWNVDSSQTLLNFHIRFKHEDSLKLASQPVNQVMRAWQRHYQEGAIENSTMLWMHPIRNNQYILTEIAPFPCVKFPLTKGKTWSSSLSIYEGWGLFSGTVDNVYTIETIVPRTYTCGTFKCWKITGQGTHDKLGISTVEFYFNEELGFTEMNYIFYNGQRIEFKLIDFST